MGADLLIAALVIDEGREIDFGAADRVITMLRASDVTDPESFDEEDPDSPGVLEQIRDIVRGDLTALRLALGGETRELAVLHLRGARVYITGGMSLGESPTELSELIWRLRAVRGVLAAAGFEQEP